ncbi:MAG: hypothetical protein LBH25_08980 [Fibromonadaceae bacterium]|jgi:flagellin|nr:hypothetical protein [Fibromonadaceae bacterium]
MAMQVNKAASIGMVHQVNQKQKGLFKTFEKLGTGKEINRAQDNSAGLAIAKLLESMSRGYKADAINIGDAMSAFNIGEGATQGISNMVGRMHELSVQAANDTLTDTERSYLNDEFQQLKQEIDRQTKNTEFNTQDLLSGKSPLSDGSGILQVGPNAGGPNEINVAKSDLRPESLGIMDLDISTRNGATASIDGLGKANEVIINTRVNFGTQYNRLEYTYNNNQNMNINTTDAMSRIEDLDFAKAAMDKARDKVLSQSAVMALRNFQDVSRNSMLALLGN